MARRTTLALYSFAAAGLIGCGALFLSKDVLAKGLHGLQVVPRAEGVSELYFTNYRKPADSFRPGSAQNVKFTVRNLEHQTTTYRYRIVTRSPGNAPRVEDAGEFTLADNAPRATNKTIPTPQIIGRTAVEVELDYAGKIPGSTTDSPQRQSIHYWIDVVGSGAGEQSQL